MSLINSHVGPVALSSDRKYDFMRETHPDLLFGNRHLRNGEASSDL